MFGHIAPQTGQMASRVEAAPVAFEMAATSRKRTWRMRFQRPLFDLFPGVRSIAADAESALARPVQISGAGPAMYVLAPDLVTALRDAHKDQADYSGRARSRILRTLDVQNPDSGIAT